MRQWLQPALALGAISAFSSCEQADNEVQETPETSQDAGSSSTNMGRATLGPLTYTFDLGTFTQTEVSLPIPPDYDVTVFASKLISDERASMLGNPDCRYGERDEPVTCEAAKESGLALALLDRPIDEYREAFTEEGIAAEELEAVRLDGADGFSFTAQAEGRGTHYNFLEVEDRTMLLARSFDGEDDAFEGEIEAVLRSLALSLDRHNGR